MTTYTNDELRECWKRTSRWLTLERIREIERNSDTVRGYMLTPVGEIDFSAEIPDDLTDTTTDTVFFRFERLYWIIRRHDHDDDIRLWFNVLCDGRIIDIVWIS